MSSEDNETSHESSSPSSDWKGLKLTSVADENFLKFKMVFMVDINRLMLRDRYRGLPRPHIDLDIAKVSATGIENARYRLDSSNSTIKPELRNVPPNMVRFHYATDVDYETMENQTVAVKSRIKRAQSLCMNEDSLIRSVTLLLPPSVLSLLDKSKMENIDTLWEEIRKHYEIRGPADTFTTVSNMMKMDATGLDGLVFASKLDELYHVLESSLESANIRTAKDLLQVVTTACMINNFPTDHKHHESIKAKGIDLIIQHTKGNECLSWPRLKDEIEQHIQYWKRSC